MEVLRSLSGTQLLFPAVAVAVVLICATLVFALGFRVPVEPAFDKSPLLQDDRKQNNKRRKLKDKKSSPNHSSSESKSESSKKSPAKEKKEDKVKEPLKPKEKPAEPKVKADIKKDTETKRGKKGKSAVNEEKPVDFDEGDWEEVPKKEKKKPKSEEKKESPAKKSKKKKETEDLKKEEGVEVEAKVEVVLATEVEGAEDKDEVNRDLREKINELQRVLKEAELRDNGILEPEPEPEPESESEPADVVDSDKKKKKDKKKPDASAASENARSAGKENIPEPVSEEDNKAAVVFDELGDSWAEAKAPKKSKKKVRKE